MTCLNIHWLSFFSWLPQRVVGFCLTLPVLKCFPLFPVIFHEKRNNKVVMVRSHFSIIRVLTEHAYAEEEISTSKVDYFLFLGKRKRRDILLNHFYRQTQQETYGTKPYAYISFVLCLHLLCVQRVHLRIESTICQPNFVNAFKSFSTMVSFVMRAL